MLLFTRSITTPVLANMVAYGQTELHVVPVTGT
jgi:hypothetical protein